jgi:hypothetical protein
MNVSVKKIEIVSDGVENRDIAYVRADLERNDVKVIIGLRHERVYPILDDPEVNGVDVSIAFSLDEARRVHRDLGEMLGQ